MDEQTDKKLDGISDKIGTLSGTVTTLSGRVDTLVGTVYTLSRTVDRILVAVVDTQEDVSNLKERMGRVETTVNETYTKIDGFMALINRHEAEIAGLHHAVTRLEERIERLEAARA